MNKAVIYDMDGLIIDSEPIWNNVEIEVFSGVGLHLTEETCREPTGLRVDEAVAYWYHRFPWKGSSQEAIIQSICTNVSKRIKTEGSAKKGTQASLNLFKKLGFRIALASSSPLIIINTVLEKLRIHDYFEVVHSAENEEYGKPHPGVYIATAKKMNVSPHDCIAIEDSITGIIAAKAAKMKCIAVPDILNLTDKRLGIADLVLSSLDEIKIQNIKKL